MTELHIDYETQSPLDLDEVGVDVYFSDHRTKILMCAYAFNDGPVKVWECHKDTIPADLNKGLRDNAIIKVAWNSPFEHTATHKCLDIFIPFESMKDPSTNGRYMSMPGSLEDVGKILKIPADVLKNADRGKELVKLFCEPIPQKVRKPASDENAFWAISPLEDQEKEREYRYRDHITHPREWNELVEYCRQDVVAERAIQKLVERFQLTPTEKKMYALDQKINQRGIGCDKDFAKKCYTLALKNKDFYVKKMKFITGVENPNSNDQMLAWVQPKGYPYSSLRKEPVGAALTDKEVILKPECREALEILKYVKKTSYTKLEAMQKALSPDQRLHWQFLFYGSPRAGRWTGKNVQLQNMARPIKAIEKKGMLVRAIELIKRLDYDGLEQLFPKDPVIEIVTSCIRSALVSAPGLRLDVSDLNAIENRVLGWVSGEQEIIKVFTTLDGKGRPKCPYLDFASFWFGIPYDVLKDRYDAGDPEAKFMRQISKPAVLGCGYRQAGGDWTTNKNGDRVKSGLWKYAEDMFCPMTKEQAHEAVAIFRKRFKKVQNFWYDSERAVIRCIKSGSREWIGPTHLIWCNRRKRKDGTFVLQIHLPSGRILNYLNATVEEREMDGRDGKKYTKDTILYEGPDPQTHRWRTIAEGGITSHGGKITENIVQGIARDILVVGMLRADEVGLNIVGHVHDEIITENPDVPDGEGLGLDDLVACMREPIDWAPGLPLEANGWSGYYYKK